VQHISEMKNKGVDNPEQKMVLYDYAEYTFKCGPGIGLFNGLAQIAVLHWGLPSKYRWVVATFVVPCILSIFMDIIPLLSGKASTEYNLNLLQSIRLFIWRIALYIATFYGVCYNVEQLILAEVNGQLPSA